MRMMIVVLVALAMTGCATGKCRQVVHEADTVQLSIKTTWRGKNCAPRAAVEEDAKP